MEDEHDAIAAVVLRSQVVAGLLELPGMNKL